MYGYMLVLFRFLGRGGFGVWTERSTAGVYVPLRALFLVFLVVCDSCSGIRKGVLMPDLETVIPVQPKRVFTYFEQIKAVVRFMAMFFLCSTECPF